MRAVEIIRDLLDIIERIEGAETTDTSTSFSGPATGNATVATGVDQNRFKQILDLLAKQPKLYDNSPADVVASVDSVTVHAGGGLNGPKNPADMRADSVAMYPGYQAKG